MLREVGGDLLLELLLLVLLTHGLSRVSLCRPARLSLSSCSAAAVLAVTSILPVTAAVMRAARRSRARAIKDSASATA
ncbi:hypothetical protein QJS66_19295 [Kocuria rhizophila]|nr:hypothetical protein QJS66_19295 [Kocuria rhizophila]